MRSRQFPGAYRSCERFVGAIKVAAKNQAQSLVERRCRCHDILLGAPAYRVGGVGQHLFHPAAAHQRAKYGGMRFGVRVIRLRPSRYCQRSTASAHRSASAGRPIIAKNSAASTAIIGCPFMPP